MRMTRRQPTRARSLQGQDLDRRHCRGTRAPDHKFDLERPILDDDVMGNTDRGRNLHNIRRLRNSEEYDLISIRRGFARSGKKDGPKRARGNHKTAVR